MTCREVALGAYRVTIARDALTSIGEIVGTEAPAHRYALITDDNVGPRYAARIRASVGAERTTVFTIAAGESHKTRDTWASLTDALLGADFGRDTTVIALGGGVVGDLAGFVAATYMRGIPLVQIPTTLLAMVDASVGGKTGVDTAAGKNLVGAFHQPAAVVADASVLASLPPAHLRAGMAEAIKHGVIADEEYFDLVSQLAAQQSGVDVTSDAMLDLIARSIKIKADVVQRDEREGGVRKTLNFGHTIGHALESFSGYSLLHGEAVAIGMACEGNLAERIGVAERGTASRIRASLRAAGLPYARPASMPIDDVIRAARRDKKARAGQAEFALPTRIGAMAGADRGWSVTVREADVRDALADTA